MVNNIFIIIILILKTVWCSWLINVVCCEICFTTSEICFTTIFEVKKVAVNINRINLIEYSPSFYIIKCAAKNSEHYYENIIVINKETDPESYEKINKFLINSQAKY